MTTNWNKKTVGIMVLIALVFLGLGTIVGGGASNSHEGHDHANKIEQTAKEEVWTCSMHPQIQMPGPGKCPICGMDLILLESGGGDLDTEGPSIQLSPYARKLAKVQTVKVLNGSLNGHKELTGTIAWNESLLKTEPAWFGGRIEKLNVSYTGQYVKKGQVIAEIYSPDLYAAAEEWKQANVSGDKILLAAVEKKLELLGFDEAGIKQLATVNSERVIQRAKHSGVVVHRNIEEGQYVKTGTPLVKLGSTKNLWVELEVFESDLPLIRKGQLITMNAESLPSQEFTAKVDFIDPVLNPKTRTIRIRLSIRNYKNLLKPGMLVRGKLNIKGNEERLYIPESSPLLTGERAVVYVEELEGIYTSRTVVLGELRTGFYEVLSGLTGTETVVKRGAFKIDAAMQIQANPSMMYPEGGGPAGAHDHGSHGEDSKKTTELMNDHSEHQVADTKPVTPQKKKAALKSKDKAWLNAIYDAYISLQTALAGDDAQGAAKALNSFAMKLHTTPKSLDDGHAHHRAASFEKAASSNSIEAIRKEMITVSEIVIDWLKMNKFQPKKGASIYFCPMENNNKGAEWLQTGGNVQNPYYGTAMLSCGEKRSVLTKGDK